MPRTARIVGNSVRSLRRNWLRTFFMMLGTFAGITALIVIVAIGRGTQQDVLEKMERMLSGSSILLAAGGSHMRGGARDASTTTLTLADLSAIDSTMQSVVLVDPLLMAGAKEVIHGSTSGQIPILGHSETSEVLWNRSVTRGSYFTSADVQNVARVALVGERVAREFFQGQDPIGEQIRIGTVPFQVIGVLEPIGMDPHGIDKDYEIIVPISTLMRRVMNIDYIGNAKIGLEPSADLDGAVLEVEEILRKRHALGPNEPNDFAMYTPVQVENMVRSANRVFTLFLPLIAAVSMLVGGLVVANLMFMTVNERRTEIGLRKAVGARAHDIRLQFLAEAAAVTALGGVLALASGYVVLRMLAVHGQTPAPMPWGTAWLGVALAAVIGMVSGLAPARRAAALDPVQTLR